MMCPLAPGQYEDLDTRNTGGPIVRRDVYVEDAYQVNGHGGELYRDEIKKLAELAGFEVSE